MVGIIYFIYFKDRNIKKYLITNNHTNILVMNIPLRYDLPNSVFINKCISALNNRLHKLTKAYSHTNFLVITDNRNLSTRHGLHRNNIGKKIR